MTDDRLVFRSKTACMPPIRIWTRPDQSISISARLLEAPGCMPPVARMDDCGAARACMPCGMTDDDRSQPIPGKELSCSALDARLCCSVPGCTPLM
eukprot:358823-Chlamydomonas_euryale.AAC.3